MERLISSKKRGKKQAKHLTTSMCMDQEASTESDCSKTCFRTSWRTWFPTTFCHSLPPREGLLIQVARCMTDISDLIKGSEIGLGVTRRCLKWMKLVSTISTRASPMIKQSSSSTVRRELTTLWISTSHYSRRCVHCDMKQLRRLRMWPILCYKGMKEQQVVMLIVVYRS